MGIAIVFALSFNMLLGQTGLLSFGHAVYFGLGGYAADPRDERAINARPAAPDRRWCRSPAALGGLVFGIVVRLR